VFFTNATSGLTNPAPAMKYSSRSAKDASIWQCNLRAKLFKLLKMDDLIANRDSVLNPKEIKSYQPYYHSTLQDSIALNPKEIKSENKGAYMLKEIEFNSTPDRRIRVLFTVPTKTKGPLPAVVCIHGHGGAPGTVYAKGSVYKGFAKELAANNYVTIAAVVSQHVIYEEGSTLMGERLWDLMRCVDYLESLPKVVDKSQIGCAGLSLGGEMAMWLGAMDTRIKATVSAGFLTTMDHMEHYHCMCWKVPGLRELVDYTDIYSLTAPRILMCQNGLKEPPKAFTVALATEALKEIKVIYTNLKQPENVFLVAHDGGHEINLPSLLTYFDKQLGSKKQ
jgi:esterase/lipase